MKGAGQAKLGTPGQLPSPVFLLTVPVGRSASLEVWTAAQAREGEQVLTRFLDSSYSRKFGKQKHLPCE